MKTVRFSQVVARSGSPEAYTLWMDPAEDSALQKALKEHRVMTVHQQQGSKKDFGEVGFQAGGQNGLLVFPKSLKLFAEKKIVGIDYALLQGETKTVAKKEAAKGRKPAKEAKPSPPPLRIFRPEEEEKKAERKPPVRAKKVEEKPAPPPPPPQRPAKKKPRATLKSLETAMRRAMTQLQEGKAVAAYETLQAAVGDD